MMLEREGKKTFASEALHYVDIQSKTETADGEGGFSTSWTTTKQVAAVVSPIQARQQFQYKSIGVDATHLIRIRGRLSIAEADQILFGSRIFEVLTVEDLQERGFVKVVTCKELR